MRRGRYEIFFEILVVLAVVALVSFFLHSCSHKEVTPIVVPEDTKPIVVTPDDSRPIRDEIFSIVEASPCSKYFWKNRSVAKPAYLKGMALMYAKQVCGQGSDFIKPDKIVGSNSIGPYKDALYYYGLEGSQLSTYSFLIGLGMRESSGRYCTGRDRSADWTEAHSAEAGLFQAAYVSRVFNEELRPLFKKYQADRSQCELPLFSEGIACQSHDAKTWGSGEGAQYQELAKSCPAFAVQWAAILIRSQYRHFGPIIRKEVEYNKSCESMLSQVEEISKGNCSEL